MAAWRAGIETSYQGMAASNNQARKMASSAALCAARWRAENRQQRGGICGKHRA